NFRTVLFRFTTQFVIEDIPELPLLIFGQFRQFFENFMEAHFSFYQFTFLPPFRERLLSAAQLGRLSVSEAASPRGGGPFKLTIPVRIPTGHSLVDGSFHAYHRPRARGRGPVKRWHRVFEGFVRGHDPQVSSNIHRR